ncbi:hypothetical protein CEXT_410921 [Caerostris extrusa]|uniref:Uncharacterized protein n=1 Tax=Caerostris extrusa TaxID=172846 RepID=A0AAV4MDG6_CAEEX|nr:hypothetical protein CEXT_410921 [Caerostris extrusa]
MERPQMKGNTGDPFEKIILSKMGHKSHPAYTTEHDGVLIESMRQSKHLVAILYTLFEKNTMTSANDCGTRRGKCFFLPENCIHLELPSDHRNIIHLNLCAKALSLTTKGVPIHP